MKWDPNETSNGPLSWWPWIFAPVWVPFAALIFVLGAVLLGAQWCKRWLVGPTEEWQPWFAWHPVDVQPWPKEERVWLEWVERRSFGLFWDTVYRSPSPAHASGSRKTETDRG